RLLPPFPTRRSSDLARAGVAVTGLNLESEPGRVLPHPPSLGGAQTLARHCLRLRDAEQVEDGRGDVGQDAALAERDPLDRGDERDRKSTRLNSSHVE